MITSNRLILLFSFKLVRTLFREPCFKYENLDLNVSKNIVSAGFNSRGSPIDLLCTDILEPLIHVDSSC